MLQASVLLNKCLNLIVNKFLLLSFILLYTEAYSQRDSSALYQIFDKALLISNHSPVRICSDSLKWTDAKPPLPSGAKVAVLEGNPKEPGHFTIRIKMPPNYKVPPHVHPVDERATVLKGAMYIGYGDILDEKKAEKISEGCFYLNPAGVHHYAFTGKEETILQISTNGPWGLHYIETIEH
jgi:quercetin dioxygenase-like cupin family protein